MDAYPEDYVNHNLPLVLLSGLEADSEDGSSSSRAQDLLRFSPLSGAVAEELRRVLLEEDGSQMPWRSTTGSNGNPSSPNMGYRIKSTGRSYRLPPRKADPPRSSPPASPTDTDNDISASSSSFVLHSPISPLSPSSPTFPDGLLTPLWVTKHQELVPAAVITFFPLSLDSNMNSLRDNQLKIEINSLKKEWATTGFKSRFLVVLISEEGEGGYIGEIDDRVAAIRRATNLDQKSIFVIPPDATSTELKEFVKSLFALLQPSVVEYYRDLSKHARRKRNRSSIPPPTAPPTSGTSQTLSLQGWNVRYEFKLGIFAEFRQEMDAACRNYEGAYGTLFGQEVFENIAGWSPRFEDARLLGDTLAIRIIRCLLWTNQTTAAARFWVDHRINTKGIINRRGKGSKNYGWEAWEARWSMIMAQLIRRAETFLLPREGSADHTLEVSPVYNAPEKSIPAGEKVNPWEHLHHEGYWLYRSAKHTMLRRALAQQIPTEDRIAPGQTPASQIASKSYLYDTYLAPETYVEAPQTGQIGFDHSQLILNTLKAAHEEYSKRQQTRKVESLSLEIAEEYMRIGSWSDAYSVLQPHWSTLSWRRSGWWQLMEKLGWALRESALKMEDSETVLRVDWELLNRVFPSRSTWHYDIHKSLEDIPSEKPKPSVVLRAEDVMTSLTASLAFEKSEGNVGEPLQAQLTISSSAQKSSCPIKLSEIKLVFEGCLRPVKLQSDRNQNADTTTPCIISSLSLREPSISGDSTVQSPAGSLATLLGVADLSIGASQTKVFNLTCIPREAGEAQVASITMLMEEEKFDLAYVITDHNSRECFWWQKTKTGTSRRRTGKDRDTGKCKVMPKPPKIRISTPNLRETYYTNERVALEVTIHNEEDEAADVSSEIRLFGSPESAAKLEWSDTDDISDAAATGTSSPTESPSHFLKRTVGVMERSSVRDLSVILANTQDAVKYSLEISAVYHLVSDVQTPIIKTITVELLFIRPFEANYEFLPQIHPQPWPNFFSVSDDLIGNDPVPTPGGLLQRWCLNSKVVSFATEPLLIDKVALKLLNVTGGAVCTLEPEVLVSPETPHLSPEELRDSNFFLDIQKLTLGDRRPSAVNLALEIAWRRQGSGAISSDTDERVTLSTLEIPRFVVPMGEPRVLASASASSNLLGLVHLDYTLENPSTHFLTFNLMMEASEQFAFSGPKTTVIQLVPLSRHTVRYNLLAAKRGLWIQPQLVVVDTYFNKTLRVLPTGDMRADKKGISVWVDAED
ncbi:uncharacterized protein N7459_003673 [Penicillium hispanicum]|uniref:uncharacterized protein n=1 Tax=Penicillium hispanicum TaxID=1080232 RepID=UPI002542468E|nr:uncharacterized protein N7459_003673 [Penicillium hispanicum]KAJ5587908.1 hypothetical protein N7459_003673 [Penicillium hispanicum]